MIFLYPYIYIVYNSLGVAKNKIPEHISLQHCSKGS